MRQNLASGVYLVGVPIGTARDITLRALDTLASADVLAAEDTRSLRKLMDIHGVPLDGRRIVSLHDHSGQPTIDKLLDQAAAGKSVAYASEAGMPLIADPGFELVRASQIREIPVTTAPGPSAVLTALAIAGLPTDAFHFTGFLPSSKSARRTALEALKEIPATLVLFESPKRVAAMLADAADVLGADRAGAVCRELTKRFEETLRGDLQSLAKVTSARKLKGELVVLIDRAAQSGGVKEIFLDDVLSEALTTMTVKDAAAYVAVQTGFKRRDIYQRALELAKAARNEGNT